MDGSDVLQRVDDALSAMVAGQRWLIAMAAVVPAGRRATDLVDRGAESCFALGAQRGAGDLPDPEVCAHRILPSDGQVRSMMEAIHDSERDLRDLPSEVQAQIDTWDSDGRARVLGDIFSNGLPVAGRRCFGGRPAAWQALEDKVVIDDVWDAAGIGRAPVRIVAAKPDALRGAAAELDAGDGTVWAGGLYEGGGFHGGAEGTWWVRDAASERLALDGMAAFTQARVMPFLEGLPCSIHGLVFPDRVVTTRPAELLTLRKAGGRGFMYARAASFWRPEDRVVDAIRAVGVRVGEHLRRTVGFRGAFTVDGVWTRDGFRPTELNPRVGAALSLVMWGLDGYLLNAALIEGVDIGVSSLDLERALRAAAADSGAGSITCVSGAPCDETVHRGLRWGDDHWVEEPDEDAADATLMWGPHPTGSILKLRFDPAKTPFGPSVAPRAAAFVRWADETLGTGFGAVGPALPPD